MNKTRSHTYFKTVPNDNYAVETIKAIRDGAIAFNLNQKAQSLTSNDPTFVRQTKRVDVFGRLGRKNPNSSVYSSAKRKFYSISNPYQRIRPEHAVAFDVYITTENWRPR